MSLKLNIFIVLMLPTKSVFKALKKHVVYNIHRLAWDPYVRGAPCNCPACPCVKTTLITTACNIRHDTEIRGRFYNSIASGIIVQLHISSGMH
jgi:hypothetical protein